MEGRGSRSPRCWRKGEEGVMEGRESDGGKRE